MKGGAAERGREELSQIVLKSMHQNVVADSVEKYYLDQASLIKATQWASYTKCTTDILVK